MANSAPQNKPQLSAELLFRAHRREYSLLHRHSKRRPIDQQGFVLAPDEPRRTCIDAGDARFALCSKITPTERDALAKSGFSVVDFEALRQPRPFFFNWLRPCFGGSEPLSFSGRLGQGTYSRVKLAKRLPALPSSQTQDPWRDLECLSETPEFFAVKAYGGSQTQWFDWRDGLALMELEVAILEDLSERTPAEDQQFLATKDFRVARTFDSKHRDCLYAFMPLGLCNFEGIAWRHAKSLDAILAEQPAEQPLGEGVEFLRKTVYSLLRSLQNLHRLDIVHRDIKPANMMLTREGRCVLIDFGLARYIPEPEPEPITSKGAKRDARCDVTLPDMKQSELQVIGVGALMTSPQHAVHLCRGKYENSAEAAFQNHRGQLLRKANKGDSGALPAVSVKAENRQRRRIMPSQKPCVGMTARTGTLLYMAPECLPSQGRIELTHPKALDIWSLGASVLEMTQGVRAVKILMRSSERGDYVSRHSARRQSPAEAGTPGDTLAGSVVDANSFIWACLQPLPEDRPTVAALLNSPWLRELGAERIDWAAYKMQALQYHSPRY
jgi:serine/threonine protein kinase